MDAIFKALNDPTRRALLDSLRKKDGQTLSELETQLDMSRFGVMKHLRVLEDASLVVTRKAGRFKHHHLNALPLQEVIDRWIDPFLAKPAARAVIDLKARLEGATEMTEKPDFVLQTFIRCSQDALWEALNDEKQIEAYNFMARRVEREGDDYRLYFGDGRPMYFSRIIERNPKTRIVSTFEPHCENGSTKPSRTVVTIRPEGAFCSLMLEHFGLTDPVVPGQGVSDGWSKWAAALKTWLETGKPMHFEAPVAVPA